MQHPSLTRYGPWLGAALTGTLQALCFAPWNQAWLAWFALLPLIFALWTLPTDASRWRPAALGYTAGVFFFTLSLYWLGSLGDLFQTPALFGLPLLLSIYLALYPALWAWLLARPPAAARSPIATSFGNIAFAFAGASAWVVLDWLRGWLFTGFAWNTPGICLHRNLALIQIADIFGVHGLSLILVFANLCFALAIRRLWKERSIRALPNVRIELMAVLLLVASGVSYGARSILNARRTGVPLKLVCLQPNQPQETLFDPSVEDRVFETIDRLMGLATTLNPQLIIWPEAATPRGIFADIPNRDFFEKQTARTSAALLFGSVEPHAIGGYDHIQLFNSALLASNNGTSLQSYRKRHLVPFGEFLPFRDWLPSAVRALVPGDLIPGKEANLLHLEKPAARIGALICFEDSLARETRTLAREGAQLLVNLTNDAWFGETAAAEQHFAHARFRAIETRLPLVRCANTGMTCVIDRLGRIEREIPPFSENLLSTEVIFPADPQPSPYTRWGDNWLWACAFSALRLAANRRKQHPSAPLAGAA